MIKNENILLSFSFDQESQPAVQLLAFSHFHFRLVRAEGLEPPRLAAREPKSRVSTNSTTPARRLPNCRREPSGRASRAESRAS